MRLGECMAIANQVSNKCMQTYKIYKTNYIWHIFIYMENMTNLNDSIRTSHIHICTHNFIIKTNEESNKEKIL